MRKRLTRELAWTLAEDAANQHMLRHGRRTWDADDYNLAVRMFTKLWPIARDLGAGDRVRGNLHCGR